MHRLRKISSDLIAVQQIEHRITDLRSFIIPGQIDQQGAVFVQNVGVEDTVGADADGFVVLLGEGGGLNKQ